MSDTHIWPSQRQYCTDANIIRNKFNDGQLYERFQKGELKVSIVRSRHRSPASMPRCTHSQVLIYKDKGRALAMVHQYLLPDGSIGASGKPDPKWVVDGDIMYILSAAHKE